MAQQGGAIYTLGSLSLEKALIKNNRASVAAGAIYVGKDLLLQSSIISNNHVLKTNTQGIAGAVFIDDGQVIIKKSMLEKNSAYVLGCLMQNSGLLHIEQSIVKENQSFAPFPQGGTVFLSEGKVIINKSKILNNKTIGLWSGGVVSFLGNILAQDSEFSGNECNGPGGAIAANFGSSVDVINCKIKNNVAGALGAALVNFSPVGKINIKGSLIKDNILTNNSTLGTILDGFLTTNKSSAAKKAFLALEAVVERNNVADGIAGIIGTISPTTVQDTKIVGNKIQGGKGSAIGGLFLIGRNNVIENSVIKNNTVEAHIAKGSAIFSTKELQITKSKISKNHLHSKNNGLGTIYIDTGSINIQGSVIKSNKATKGAGIYLTSGVSMSIEDYSVIKNVATSTGGGIYADTTFNTQRTIIAKNYPDNVYESGS